jgi:signal transduction histidine kinase
MVSDISAASLAPLSTPHWRLRRWTAEDGLPHNRVQAIAQTPDGYLWLGTHHGLVRFDGVRFVTFAPENMPGLASGAVSALAVAPDGALWLTTTDGLVEVRGGRVARRLALGSGETNKFWQVVIAPDNGVWWRNTYSVGRVREDRLETLGTAAGVPADTVKFIRATPEGGVLVYGRFGVRRWNGAAGRFEPAAEWARERHPLDVAEDAAGNLWMGDGWGLHRYESATPPERGFPNPQRVDEAEAGEVLKPQAGQAAAALESRAPGRWSFLDSPVGTNEHAIKRLQPAPRGGWWVTTERDALFLWRDGGFMPVPLPEVSERGGVGPVIQDREGNTWIGTGEGGLFQLRELPVRSISVREGLPHHKAWSVWPAREGGVWVGTDAGLARIAADGRAGRPAPGSPEPQRHRAGKGVGDSETNSAREAAADLEIRAPNARSRATRAPGVWRGPTTLETDSEWRVPGVLEDRSGAVWFSKPGRPHPSRIGQFTREGFWDVLPAELPTSMVSSFHEDRAGRVWIGFDNGMVLHEQGRFTRLATAEGVLDANVRAVLEDRAGRFWIGTEGKGVLLLERGSPEPQREGMAAGVGNTGSERAGVAAAGLETRALGTETNPFALWRTTTFVTNRGLAGNKVWALHEDGDGAVWVGGDRGLTRLKEGRAAILNTAQGLTENEVNHILEDDAGRFWWSGNKGIHVARRAELDAVADGRASRVRCATLTTLDGMANAEANGTMQPAGCRTADGRLWLPTMGGVVVVDPKLVMTEEAWPLVMVEEMAVDGEVVWKENAPLSQRAALQRRSGSATAYACGNTLAAPSHARTAGLEIRAPAAMDLEVLTPLRIGSGQGRVLEIRYTATALAAPERTRFQWKLEPRDADWRDAGTQRAVVLHHLKPGTYTFRVRAGNHRGLWNESGAGLPFIIAPRFHETWMFYAACAAGIVAVASAFTAYRLRWQRRLLTVRHGQAMSEERARIARDLHDDLGTALTGVALEIDLARRQARNGIAEQLGESAARVRSLAERMREAVWAVNPQCDTVPSLASFLEQQAGVLLRGNGVRGRCEFPEDIPPLPLDSATRHQLALAVREALTNVQRHAHATEVVLSLELRDGALVITVRDNGRGFDSVTAREAPGHGLHNLRTRLARAGGIVTLVSKPGQGTQVEFRVPLGAAQRREEPP